MKIDRYHEIGDAICRPYVEAFDPQTPVEAYLSVEPGVIGVVEAEVTHCWDYADDFLMPPTAHEPIPES